MVGRKELGSGFGGQINLCLHEFGNILVLLVHKCFKVNHQKENNIRPLLKFQ